MSDWCYEVENEDYENNHGATMNQQNEKEEN